MTAFKPSLNSRNASPPLSLQDLGLGRRLKVQPRDTNLGSGGGGCVSPIDATDAAGTVAHYLPARGQRGLNTPSPENGEPLICPPTCDWEGRSRGIRNGRYGGFVETNGIGGAIGSGNVPDVESPEKCQRLQPSRHRRSRPAFRILSAAA